LSILAHYIFRSFWVLSKHIPYFQNLFRLLRFFTSGTTQRSMDLFGNAIKDFYSNSLKSPFILYRHCLQKEYNGLKWKFDLGLYFRSFEKLYPLEKKLIDLSYGNILDIGSSTGYYIPYLMDKGNTIGIEISSKINEIARNKGLLNCIIGDIYKFQYNGTFDTITLIGNDIALSGTLYRLKKMLKKLAELLTKNGQILLIIRHIQTLKYWHVVYTPYYNGHFGIPFKILFLNVYFFCKFTSKHGFRAAILDKDDSTGILYYLVKLVKSS